MPAAHRSLADVLGAAPPASVRQLPADSQLRLVELVVQAREEQARRLTEGLEASLRHLPPPFRGLVRRLLLP